MAQNAGVLYILTCKCAWRHSGVQFFDNFSTSALQKVARDRQFFSILTCKCLATAACNFSTSQLQKVVRTCSESRILLENVLLATAACNFSTSQLQKVARDRQFFSILTCKCLATAACNFSTSQLQKVVRTCSERRIFIENVLLATAACNFSTSQLQKVVRECCVLYILTCKCASRYSGVQFFISELIHTPRPMRGAIPIAQNLRFATVSRDRPTESYERVHPAKSKCAFRYSGAPSKLSKCTCRYSGVRKNV